MAERKTLYRHNRLGPKNLLELVQKNPAGSVIRFKGLWYMYMVCCCCGREYWREYRTSTGTRYLAVNPHHTYCSERCALRRRRALNAARQARYRAKNNRSRPGARVAL